MPPAAVGVRQMAAGPIAAHGEGEAGTAHLQPAEAHWRLIGRSDLLILTEPLRIYFD